MGCFSCRLRASWKATRELCFRSTRNKIKVSLLGAKVKWSRMLGGCQHPWTDFNLGEGCNMLEYFIAWVTFAYFCQSLPRLHKATPISNGRRHNLILWCRSSDVRNDLCPMCFQQPNVVPTNRYYHEGFSVPPCKPSMVQTEADTASDDLYDWVTGSTPMPDSTVWK